MVVEDFQFEEVARQRLRLRLLLLEFLACRTEPLVVFRDQLADRSVHAFEADRLEFHGAEGLLNLFGSLVQCHDQAGLAVARRTDHLKRRAQFGDFLVGLADVLCRDQSRPAGDTMEPADLFDGRLQSLPGAEHLQHRLKVLTLIGESIHPARHLLGLIQQLQGVPTGDHLGVALLAYLDQGLEETRSLFFLVWTEKPDGAFEPVVGFLHVSWPSPFRLQFRPLLAEHGPLGIENLDDARLLDGFQQIRRLRAVTDDQHFCHLYKGHA